jgi:CHAT domain-containing protein
VGGSVGVSSSEAQCCSHVPPHWPSRDRLGPSTIAVNNLHLGRAFFYAGTRAVLVTHWPVESASARSLTTELFRRQVADKTLTRAGALREAQLALIEGPGAVDPRSGTVQFAYAHPMFWAPFALVGDGGGTTR